MAAGCGIKRQYGDAGLVCRKKNRKVDPRKVECADPDAPCKFRSECMVYALWQEEQSEKAESKRRRKEDKNGK